GPRDRHGDPRGTARPQGFPGHPRGWKRDHGRAGDLPARLGRNSDRGRCPGDARRVRGPLRHPQVDRVAPDRLRPPPPSNIPLEDLDRRRDPIARLGEERSCAGRLRRVRMAETSPGPTEPLDVERIHYLARLMKRYDLTSLDLADGRVQIRLRRRGPEITSLAPALVPQPTTAVPTAQPTASAAPGPPGPAASQPAASAEKPIVIE